MKVFKGRVVSTKMEKTATVMIRRVVVHPVYRKRYRRTKKYQVHDTFGVKVGSEVSFVATKPYSKLKKWKITQILVRQKEKPKNKKNLTIVEKKGGNTKTRKVSKNTKK